MHICEALFAAELFTNKDSDKQEKISRKYWMNGNDYSYHQYCKKNLYKLP